MASKIPHSIENENLRSPWDCPKHPVLNLTLEATIMIEVNFLSNFGGECDL